MKAVVIMALLAMTTPVAASAAPEFWGDGKHDDGDALEAIFNGCPIVDRAPQGMIRQDGPARTIIVGALFLISREVVVYARRGVSVSISGSAMKNTEGQLDSFADFYTEQVPEESLAPALLSNCATPSS